MANVCQIMANAVSDYGKRCNANCSQQGPVATRVTTTQTVVVGWGAMHSASPSHDYLKNHMRRCPPGMAVVHAGVVLAGHGRPSLFALPNHLQTEAKP